MKILKAYTNGLISAARSKKMTTLIYAITFLLALIIAIPFRSALNNNSGNSMALQSLLKGFDFTTYTDFMHSAGKVINSFVPIAIWFGVFYLIFTVFFSGGVLKILTEENQKFSIKVFLASSGEFFFRFFRLAVYLLIFQAIIAIIIYLPLTFIVNFASKSVESEAGLVYIVLTGVLIHLILFILFLIVGDYTKISLYLDDSRKVFIHIFKSIRFVFRHLFSTYVLYIFLLIIPVLLFAVYFWLDSIIGMVSAFTILIMFLIQQIFVWTRTLVKIWILGSELHLYEVFKEADAQKSKVKLNVNESGENGNIIGNTI